MKLYTITNGFLGDLFVGTVEVKEKRWVYKVIKGNGHFGRKVIGKSEIDTFNDGMVLSFNKRKGIKIFREGIMVKMNELEDEYKNKRRKIEILLGDINDVISR